MREEQERSERRARKEREGSEREKSEKGVREERERSERGVRGIYRQIPIRIGVRPGILRNDTKSKAAVSQI